MAETQKVLLLIGGGHANVQVITDLNLKALHNEQPYRRILLCDNPTAVYSGMLPAVVAGLLSEKTADIDLRSLCLAYDYDFIHGNAMYIDAMKEQVHFISNITGLKSILNYSILSINVGSITRSIPFLNEGGSSVIVKTRPIAKLVPSLREFEDIIVKEQNNVIKIIIVGGGAAGVELAMSVHQRFHQRFDKSVQMTLISRGNRILELRSLTTSQSIEAEFRHRQISYITGYTVSNFQSSPSSSRPNKSEAILIPTLKNENNIQQMETKLQFDLAILATGAAPPQILEQSDLQRCETGWLSVTSTLQSVNHPNVFAAGDCIQFESSPLYPPKAGVFAVRQGPILAHNINVALSSSVGTKMKDFIPQMNYLSLISTADGRAIGTKYGFSIKGTWVFRLKMFVDEAWQRRFRVSCDANVDIAVDGYNRYEGDAVEAAAVLMMADEVITGDCFDIQLSVLRRMDLDSMFRQDVMATINESSPSKEQKKTQ